MIKNQNYLIDINYKYKSKFQFHYRSMIFKPALFKIYSCSDYIEELKIIDADEDILKTLIIFSNNFLLNLTYYNTLLFVQYQILRRDYK